MKKLFFLLLTMTSFSAGVYIGDGLILAEEKLSSKGYQKEQPTIFKKEKEEIILGIFKGKVSSILYINPDGGKSIEVLAGVYNTKQLAINCKKKERMHLRTVGKNSIIYIVKVEDGDCSEDPVKSYKVKNWGK